MRKFYFTLCFLWFLFFCTQNCVATSCFGPSLQQAIFSSDNIIFGKLETLSKDSRTEVNQLEKMGRIKVYEFQVLKGAIDESELEMRDFRISRNPFGDCDFPSKNGNDSDNAPWVIFRSQTGDVEGYFNCTEQIECNDFLQRVKEMVAIQKEAKWKGSDEEKRWLLECIASESMAGFDEMQLFDFNAPRVKGLSLKNFRNLYISEDLKNKLAAKLVATLNSKLRCEDAYLAVLVANWEDEKVITPAIKFLKELKVDQSCDIILPNLMHMVAEKRQLPNAEKFIEMLDIKDREQVLTDFINFIENETQKRRQRKIIYPLLIVGGFITLAIILFKLRKRKLAIINS